MVGQPHREPLDINSIQYGRQAQQRFQRCIYIDALHHQLGRPVSLARGGANRKTMHHQFQRPGLDLKPAHGDGTPELATGDRFNLGLEERRQRQPSQGPKQPYRATKPEQAFQAAQKNRR